MLANLEYVLAGSKGEAKVLLTGHVPAGEQNAGEQYRVPVRFSWSISTGAPPPAAEQVLVLFGLKDKVKGKGAPKAKGEPSLRVELVEDGQVVREVCTAVIGHGKPQKGPNPSWPDKLQLLIGVMLC